MNNSSPLLLLGIGTAGARIARGVSRSFGDNLRFAIADTDASTAEGEGSFTLLGGDRLSGRGSGGDIVSARLATEDSIQNLDALIEGVRLAVIVTCLGGGTGGGASLETVKHLALRGIPTIVFATLPFQFEGDDRLRNARGIMSMLEDASNAIFFLPLDKLVGETDNMNEALQQAVRTVADGVTLFWRLIEKPGYIKLDADRVRHLINGAGRGRFAAVTCEGPNRAGDAVDKLIRSELLATANSPVKAALCGVLAGDDLRLSELSTISNGVQEAFGEHIAFDLGTVNDNENFADRLSVVVMLFEMNGRDTASPSVGGVLSGRKRNTKASALTIGPSGRGRFNSAERSEWHGEDLDVPTFIRHNITLEF